jgi:hypothetical protein
MITSARDTFERSDGHVNSHHLIPVGILLRCSVAFVRESGRVPVFCLGQLVYRRCFAEPHRGKAKE